MEIVETYTDIPGTVNEKLAARKFAIDYLMEEGIEFDHSPTSLEICGILGIDAKNRKQASARILEWAATRRGF